MFDKLIINPSSSLTCCFRKGHTKAVSCARLFPTSAHLLLSASMDCTVRVRDTCTKFKHLLMHQFCLLQLWDVYGQRAVLRTYQGHNKGVRDVCFDHDGHRFLSCSYDRYIKLWDTETGQCIRRFTNRRVPYTVRFHPDPSMQKEFLAGCSDKKIIQVCLSLPIIFPLLFVCANKC